MTNRKYTNRSYLDALEKKVLVFDGAMGTSLQLQDLTAEHFGGEQYNGCNDYLVISYPEAVEKVHRSFLEVGVDVLETDTFRSNRITMAEYDLGDRVIEINETAAKLARRLADEYSVKCGNRPSEIQNRFVAGSIGPSGKLPSANDPELSNVSFDELADVFREQAVGLIRGGVDLLLIETSQDILEVKAAITGIHQAFDETGVYLPIQAQVTLDTTGRMLLGTDVEAALAILEGLGIDVIGLNCSTGPEHMREPIRVLGENATLPVSCIPNAGLPLNVDGQAVYPLEPEPYANDMYEFVTKHNISVVGGCCGTTPEHLRLLVEKLDNHPHPDRPHQSEPKLASAMSAVAMQAGSPANPDRRTLQRARLAQVQAPAARRRLRHHSGDRPRTGRIRRAHARYLHRRHRTPRRSRPDAQRGQETRNGRGRAAGDRHHRTGRARSGAQNRSRPLPDQFHPSRIRALRKPKRYSRLQNSIMPQ